MKNHFWSFIFGKEYKGAKVIVDKTTLDANFFKLKNDFYGGIELNTFFASNNGMFVSSINAFKLMTEIDNTLENNKLDTAMKNKLEAIRKRITENDNQVLFIGKFK